MEHTNAYNDKVVRQFAIMTVVWGVIGMLVGVLIASQLLWPQLTADISWLSYGRLRPLHANALIFAFGGCGLFATSYYVVQRTCHVRLISRNPGSKWTNPHHHRKKPLPDHPPVVHLPAIAHRR
jgi:cytochrome c oxidase cbb3-type subunit 1